MTWKEKIRFCIDVLFKERDIKEELNAVERERIKLGEKMITYLKKDGFQSGKQQTERRRYVKGIMIYMYFVC